MAYSGINARVGSIFWKQKGFLLENRCQNIHFWTGNICGYSGKCACLKNDLQYIPESIDATIDEANDLADESEAAKDDDKDSKKSKDSESSFIDKAKDAVNSVKNTLSVTADSVKNMVNKFIDGLAVLIVTTCLIPVLVIVFFIWLVKLVLGSAISSPGAVAMRRGKDK